MDEITIITNNVPRDIIHSWELSPEEQKEFDYYDWKKIEKGEGDDPEFVRYKGELLDLSGDFETTARMLGHVFQEKWDGYKSDSFFSGILVRYVEYNERVVMGRYYS